MKRTIILILVLLFVFTSLAEPEWVFPQIDDGSSYRYLGVSEDGNYAFRVNITYDSLGLFSNLRAEFQIVDTASGENRPLTLRTDDQTEAFFSSLAEMAYNREKRNGFPEWDEFKKLQFEKYGYSSWFEAYLSRYSGLGMLENIGNLALFRWYYGCPVLVNLKTGEAMPLSGETTLSQNEHFIVKIIDENNNPCFDLYEGFEKRTRIPVIITGDDFFSETAFRLLDNGNIAYVSMKTEFNSAERTMTYFSYLNIIDTNGALKNRIDLGSSKYPYDTMLACPNGTIIVSSRNYSIYYPSIWYSPDSEFLFTPVLTLSGTKGIFKTHVDLMPYSEALELDKDRFASPICIANDKYYCYAINDLTNDFDLVSIDINSYKAEVVLEGTVYRKMSSEINPDSYISESLLIAYAIPNGKLVGTLSYGPIRLEKPSFMDKVFGKLFQ